MTTARRPVESGGGPRVLALATSTDWCSVALAWRDATGDRGAFAADRVGNDHSRALLPMAAALMREAGLAWSDVDVFAFDAGPGSFTSLRIGCGAVQGLAFATGRPVVAVSSLQALARQAGSGSVIAVLDARMNEVYAAPMRLGADAADVAAGACIPGAMQPIRTIPVGEAGDVLEAWVREGRSAGEAPVAIGDAFARHPALGSRMRSIGVGVDPTAYPRADAIAAIALARHARGQAVDPRDAAPLYVRDKVALDVDEQRRVRAARRAAQPAS